MATHRLLHASKRSPFTLFIFYSFTPCSTRNALYKYHNFNWSLLYNWFSFERYVMRLMQLLTLLFSYICGYTICVWACQYKRKFCFGSVYINVRMLHLYARSKYG